MPDSLAMFAVRLEWYARFYQGLRRVLADATSEEEAVAWLEYLREED